MLWCSLPGFPGDACSFPFSCFSVFLYSRNDWHRKGLTALRAAQSICDLALWLLDPRGNHQATSALAASFCNFSCSDKWLGGEKNQPSAFPAHWADSLSSQAPCFVHSFSCQWRCVQKQNQGLAVLTIHSCWAETSPQLLWSQQGCVSCVPANTSQGDFSHRVFPVVPVGPGHIKSSPWRDAQRSR